MSLKTQTNQKSSKLAEQLILQLYRQLLSLLPTAWHHSNLVHRDDGQDEDSDAGRPTEQAYCEWGHNCLSARWSCALPSFACVHSLIRPRSQPLVIAPFGVQPQLVLGNETLAQKANLHSSAPLLKLTQHQLCSGR